MKPLHAIVILPLILSATGCSVTEQMNAKVDMMEQHLGSSTKPLYEGKLVASQRIGPMTSLQFSDGRIIDVANNPEGLLPGDTIRVYRNENGFEAHLWRRPEIESAEANALAPAIPTQSK